MKKILSILLVGSMCISLCACGGSESTTTESTTTESTTTESENNEIAFEEGTVVIENDIAKVELVNFYEEPTDDGMTEKHITLKVKNKGTGEFLFSLGDVYIGEDAVESIMLDGNSGPIPGKANTYKYEISHNDSEYTPIDSIEQLYELDGVIEFSIYSEDGESIVDEIEEYFSFKDLNLK